MPFSWQICILNMRNRNSHLKPESKFKQRGSQRSEVNAPWANVFLSPQRQKGGWNKDQKFQFNCLSTQETLLRSSVRLENGTLKSTLQMSLMVIKLCSGLNVSGSSEMRPSPLQEGWHSQHAVSARPNVHLWQEVWASRCELDVCSIKLNPQITHERADQIQAQGHAADHRGKTEFN